MLSGYLEVNFQLYHVIDAVHAPDDILQRSLEEYSISVILLDFLSLNLQCFMERSKECI